MVLKDWGLCTSVVEVKQQDLVIYQCLCNDNYNNTRGFCIVSDLHLSDGESMDGHRHVSDPALPVNHPPCCRAVFLLVSRWSAMKQWGDKISLYACKSHWRIFFSVYCSENYLTWWFAGFPVMFGANVSFSLSSFWLTIDPHSQEPSTNN